MFKFQSRYLFAALLLLVIEIMIAVFAHDRIIRPYIGDYLVVFLLYCFIKSFVNLSVKSAALAVLLVSYLIEVLQYFNIVSLMGLQHSEFASTVVGTSFEWIDLVAYTLGVLSILWFEGKRFYTYPQAYN